MAKAKNIYLMASDDLRIAANQKCQPAQLEMESKVVAAFKKLGATVKRAHPTDRNGHCFIDSQKYGMEVFKNIPADAPSLSLKPSGNILTTSCLVFPHTRGPSSPSPTGPANGRVSSACSTSTAP